MSDDGEDNTTSLEQRASGRAWPSLAGTAGRSAACGYHAPGRSAGMAARLMVKSCGGGEGGKPTRQPPATRGLVAEPRRRALAARPHTPTAAAAAGVEEQYRQTSTRHRSLPVLRGYIRAATAFDDVGT